MKKKYLKPDMKVYEIETPQLLADSLGDDNQVEQDWKGGIS